jgi:hypothetical protein
MRGPAMRERGALRLELGHHGSGLTCGRLPVGRAACGKPSAVREFRNWGRKALEWQGF